MTSKSSFLGSLKENNKRRLWVWVVALLAFVLVIPLFLALEFNSVYQRTEWLTESYGAKVAEGLIRNSLMEVIENILGPSVLLMFFTVGLAVANAVQGFSWLYSRKKIDFYMSMPVKRSRRFLVIWLNGIFIYVISYLLGLAVCVPIMAGNHCLDAGVAKVVIQALFVNLLLYLCVYHMAVLAVMLTGNIVITGMGFLVFCLYELLVRWLDFAYKERFFRYFSASFYNTEPAFSPFTMYAKIISDPEAMMAQTKMIMMMVLFAAVLGGVSYWCYRKRPAEGAGKAMVFPITCPVIKILLVIPMALLAGNLIADEVDFGINRGMEGAGYVILVLALATVIGSAVIQVIYEFDIKGALHKKMHIVVSGIFVALIFMGYRYDLLHYDGYIPAAEKVESIAFLPSNYESLDYRSTWIEPNEGGIGVTEYVSKHMYLKNIEDVCGLTGYSMEKYNSLFPKGEGVANRDDEETDCYWSPSTVIYRMKNGKEVVRRIWVDVNDERAGGYLDRIIGSPEFQEGYLMGASDRLVQMISQDNTYQVSAYYGNLVYEQKMRETEMLELLECYQADMKNFNFTRVKENVPEGAIRIEFTKEIPSSYRVRATSTTEVDINIYPFFERSIACLKKYGYYMERQIDVEDVDRIYVTNRNSEIYQELLELQKAAQGNDAAMGDRPEVAETAEAVRAAEVYWEDIDTRGYADYTDRADIESLADYIYVDSMLSSRWDGGDSYDYDYSVLVYFKADSEMNRKYGTCANYVFREGMVPDFVQEDTAYSGSAFGQTVTRSGH